MIRVRFICRDCGYVFFVEIFEQGEAEEKRSPSARVRCRKCGSPSVERH